MLCRVVWCRVVLAEQRQAEADLKDKDEGLELHLSCRWGSIGERRNCKASCQVEDCKSWHR